MNRTGGDSNHNHVLQGDGHTHDVNAPFFTAITIGADTSATTNVSTVIAISDNASSDPPYYEVAYIMEWEGW